MTLRDLSVGFSYVNFFFFNNLGKFDRFHDSKETILKSLPLNFKQKLYLEMNMLKTNMLPIVIIVTFLYEN